MLEFFISIIKVHSLKIINSPIDSDLFVSEFEKKLARIKGYTSKEVIVNNKPQVKIFVRN
jgi:hypothetical protein